MDSRQISKQLRELITQRDQAKKTSLLRDCFSDIESALRAGITRAAILKLLAENDVEMSPSYFSVVMHRLRKERALGQFSPEKEVAAEPLNAQEPVGAPAPGEAPVRQEKRQNLSRTLDWSRLKDTKVEL